MSNLLEIGCVCIYKRKPNQLSESMVFREGKGSYTTIRRKEEIFKLVCVWKAQRSRPFQRNWMYLGKLIDRGGNVPLVFNIGRKILIEGGKHSEFHASSFNKVSRGHDLKINIAQISPFYISYRSVLWNFLLIPFLFSASSSTCEKIKQIIPLTETSSFCKLPEMKASCVGKWMKKICRKWRIGFVG